MLAARFFIIYQANSASPLVQLTCKPHSGVYNLMSLRMPQCASAISVTPPMLHNA